MSEVIAQHLIDGMGGGGSSLIAFALLALWFWYRQRSQRSCRQARIATPHPLGDPLLGGPWFAVRSSLKTSPSRQDHAATDDPTERSDTHPRQYNRQQPDASSAPSDEDKDRFEDSVPQVSDAARKPDGAPPSTLFEIDLPTLFESFGDGLLIVGHDRSIRYVSPTCLDMLGVDAVPDALVGRSLADLFAQSDRSVRYADGFVSALNAMLSGPNATDRATWPFRSGGTLLCDYRRLTSGDHLWRLQSSALEPGLPSAHLNTIFQYSQDAVMLFGRDATLLTLNPVAKACAQVIFGRSVAPGMSLQELTGHADGGGFGVDLRKALAGESLRTERHKDHGNGETWTDVRFDPVAGSDGSVVGAVFTGRDITERKRAESEEQRLRAFTEAIIESLPGMFLLSDANGQLVRWNRNVETVLGYKAHELAELNLKALYHSRTTFSAHRQTLSQRGALHTELPLKLRDGTVLPTLCTAVMLPQDTETYRVTMLLDISKQKSVEKQLRRAQRDVIKHNQTLQAQAEDLAAATRRADEANRAKSEFLSRMSHELRTPLNAINGFAQLLKKHTADDKQQRQVRHIYHAGQHLLSLINEVLDIAKVESGQFTLSLEPVALCDVIDEAMALVEPMAHAKQVALSSSVSRDVVVYADQQRVKQIVINLLSNAVKYNRQGGQVWLRSYYDPAERTERWRLHVVDTGIGIRADLQTRLFTPFERLGAEQTTTEGSGLGLALSQRLATMMGGQITVTSRSGKGSVFGLELPATTLSHHTASASCTTLDVRERWGQRYTVLYVEDNLVNLELMLHVLADQYGVRVMTAMQGRLGLELARMHRPDLILLDLHLPDLNGTEILAQLRHNPDTQDIPVVILSADAVAETRHDVLSRGAQAFIAKPFDTNDLVTTLRAHLDRS